MNRALVIIICITLTGGMVSAQNTRAHMKAAEQFISNGYYDDAVNQYNLAIDLDPQYGEAYEARAKAYFQLNKMKEACADFERAAVFGVNTSLNYYKSAEIKFKSGIDDEALETLLKALEKDQNNLEAYILQNQIFYKKGEFKKALTAAEKAYSSKSSAYTLFLRGKAEFALKDYEKAEQDLQKAVSKDKYLFEAFHILSQAQIQLNKTSEALSNCDYLIQNNINIAEAYLLKGLAYRKLHNPDKAVSNISTAISLDTLNSDFINKRGECFMDIAKYDDAINDFTVALTLDILNIEALQNRAQAYEMLSRKKEAASDYSLLLKIIDNSDINLMKSISEKIYNLLEENDKPVINIVSPQLTKNYEVPLATDKIALNLKGSIADASKIKILRVNNDTLINNPAGISPSEFTLTLDSKDLEYVAISATDIYDNTSNVSYSIARTETHPPVINLMNPYSGDDNIITLSTNDNYLYLEGRINDESLISNIRIDELNASFSPSDLNPRFTATLDISQKTRINITVTDIYGNTTEKEYQFLRDGRILSEDSPMGKTWAILIENSEYKSFTNLRSTKSDIELIQKSLSRYKINNIIIKRNLTKRELERFFSIDLRDLIRTNEVNSLFIWYAGHGENINGNGYWIPIDAMVDDEFSYYNINALKASLYSYNSLNHLLIVSDACYSGPGFCVAMRSPLSDITCSQTELTSKKSSQVFTSSGPGNAYDNSLFANSFSNSLLNNENDCVSIDEIVKRVTIIMQSNTLQNPEFGKIVGLDDQQGTFFFISR